jgi:hypothetical protein
VSYWRDPDPGTHPRKQRAEKLLGDTQIMLSGVISDIFGVSGRAMLEALIAGQRDPQALAPGCADRPS